MPIRVGTRERTGVPRVLFMEDFRLPSTGMWNDGKRGGVGVAGLSGTATRDNELTIFGMPTCRLDTQGNSVTANSPGLTGPDNSGIVFKRRIGNQPASGGIYSIEFWVNWTSGNHNANSGFSTCIYNRDGTNITAGRLWLDTTVGGFTSNAITIKLLQSNQTWVTLGTSTSSWSGTQYDPFLASYDKAGGWHYVKLAVNFTTKTYQRVQFDELEFDVSSTSPSPQNLLISADTSAGKVMHFSIDAASLNSDSTRRFWNIAQVVGMRED